MEPGQRVHRLLRLIYLLRGERPRPLGELMEKLQVSRRTLFRDLAALNQAGIPCVHERDRGYRIRETFFLPPVSLTAAEAMGLLLLCQRDSATRDKPLRAAAVSAIHKVISLVPEPVRSVCGSLCQVISLERTPHAPGDAESRYFCDLQQAIDQRRVCRVLYRSPVEPDVLSTDFEPYALHFAARAWYVFGRTSVHDQVRTLKLTRIENLALSDTRFTRPDQFSVDDHLDGAWQLIPEGRHYDIELEFTPMVATNVRETIWHPSQQVQRQPDGGAVVRFRVNGLREIAWWICGYGDQVRVVRPAELRERVRDMLERAWRQYV